MSPSSQSIGLESLAVQCRAGQNISAVQWCALQCPVQWCAVCSAVCSEQFDSSVTGCTRHATGDLGAGGRAVVQCITVQWGGRCCAVTGCVQCSGSGRAVQWLGLCSAVAGCGGEAVTARAARGEAGLATAWGEERRQDLCSDYMTVQLDLVKFSAVHFSQSQCSLVQ